MSDVVIDSSVWIDFFRGDKQARSRVDPLLVDDRAAICGPILAEVSSGAPTLAAFAQIRARLQAVAMLADPPELWNRVAEARFHLARQGVQAHLIDLTIAVTASARGHSLLTRDRDFAAIARAVSVDLTLY